MANKFRIVLIVLFVLVSVRVAAAGTVCSDAQTGPSRPAKGELVDNKICPVSGEKIGTGGMEPVTYEYAGKTYNFCCVGCIEEFKANPAKYIKIVEEEIKNR